MNLHKLYPRIFYLVSGPRYGIQGPWDNTARVPLNIAVLGQIFRALVRGIFEACRGYSNILLLCPSWSKVLRSPGPWNLVSDECAVHKQRGPVVMVDICTSSPATILTRTPVLLVYYVLVSGQTKAPPSPVELPARSSLPLSLSFPVWLHVHTPEDTYRTVHTALRLCASLALNRSTLTGSSLPCYPLLGPSSP